MLLMPINNELDDDFQYNNNSMHHGGGDNRRRTSSETTTAKMAHHGRSRGGAQNENRNHHNNLPSLSSSFSDDNTTTDVDSMIDDDGECTAYPSVAQVSLDPYLLQTILPVTAEVQKRIEESTLSPFTSSPYLVPPSSNSGGGRPRCCLTTPNIGILNNGRDNIEGHLIVYENDIFRAYTVNANTQKQQMDVFQIQQIQGKGFFAQVFSAINLRTGQQVAIKMIKNQKEFIVQGSVEVDILRQLKDDDSVVNLLSYFFHENHLCLVFELLGPSLLDVLKYRAFQGLALSNVRLLIRQILSSLRTLSDHNIIHTDLKPENILLDTTESSLLDGGGGGDTTRQSSSPTPPCKTKLIDLGSARYVEPASTLATYVQSRFYRSPEVILGLAAYSAKPNIDIWSVGCIAAELFLGLPILPGVHEQDQLRRIIDMIADVPLWMLEQGKNTAKCFNLSILPAVMPMGLLTTTVTTTGSVAQWTLKTSTEHIPYLSAEQILKQGGIAMIHEKAGKHYFARQKLADIILLHGQSRLLSTTTPEDDMLLPAFVHFLYGLLDPDPQTRWTASQALDHPFITGDIDKLIATGVPLGALVAAGGNLANRTLGIVWNAPPPLADGQSNDNGLPSTLGLSTGLEAIQQQMNRVSPYQQGSGGAKLDSALSSLYS